MSILKLVNTNGYLFLIDESKKTWGKLAYNPESNNAEIICSHPKYDEYGYEILGHLPLRNERGMVKAKYDGLPVLPPLGECVYILLADGDGTMRSVDEPFGVIVRTKEAAEEYVKNGGVGYTHSYTPARIFNTAKEGIDYVYRGQEPKLPIGFEPETEVDPTNEANWYVDCPSGKYWEDEPVPPSPDRLYTNGTRRLKTINNVLQGRWIWEK